MPTVDQTLAQRVALIAGVGMLFAVGITVVLVSLELLPLVFGAVLMAVFINVLADKLAPAFPGGTTRGVRVGILVGLIVAVFGVLGAVFADSITTQAVLLADRLDESFDTVLAATRQQPLVERLVRDEAGLRDLLPTSTKSLGMATRLFTTTFGGLTDVLLLIILTTYFCSGPDKYRVGTLRLFPPAWRETLAVLAAESAETLWRWMLGRLLSMALVGGLFAAGLSVIGVPLSIELGIFAGLVSFIPNIGALAAVIPALLLASQQGASSVVSALVLYVAIQFAESYLVTPLIQQHQVAMPPAMVVLSQIIAGLVFGFWGIVFATPFFAIVLLWIRRLYVEQYLEPR